MKTIRLMREDIRSTSGDSIRRAYASVGSSEFIDKLIANYGIFPTGKYDSEFRSWLASKLAENVWPIYHVLNGDISQKRILDLGCGSRGGTPDSGYGDTRKMYEPWLCRALLELGVSPIGVDIGSLLGERFEYHTLNLLSPDSLKFLGDNSVDVAHVELLFDSPTGYEMKGFRNLRGFLVPQLERIVKPHGYFIGGM